MDGKGALSYGRETMRLLLLLSALLGALTGVAAPRAGAQPVQAAASMPTAARVLASVAPVAVRFTLPPYRSAPPLRIDLPRLVSATTARLLYAERRRE